MTLEQTLRVSVLQAELRNLANVATPATARVLRYAASVLDLVKTAQATS